MLCWAGHFSHKNGALREGNCGLPLSPHFMASFLLWRLGRQAVCDVEPTGRKLDALRMLDRWNDSFSGPGRREDNGSISGLSSSVLAVALQCRGEGGFPRRTSGFCESPRILDIASL